MNKTEPIRILHVISSMQRAGSQRLLINLYREMDHNSIQFDLVENKGEEETEWDAEIRQGGGRIYHCPRLQKNNILQYIKWWNRFYKEHGGEYKIIHGHSGGSAPVYLAIAKKHGLYTIAHSHSAVASGYRVVGFNTLRLVRFVADFYIACSNLAAYNRFGRRIACSTEKCCILKTAINADEFAFHSEDRNEARIEFGVEGKLCVGTVGRICPEKNPAGIIHIIEKCVQRNNNFKFLWCGDGELRKSVELEIAKRNLKDHVIFLGVRNDVNRILCAMDVFILPSLYEGLANAAIEAQASGLPCLCSDTVDKETRAIELCQFIPLDDYDKWADAVMKSTICENRENYFFEVKKAGYDIREAAQYLSGLYQSKN